MIESELLPFEYGLKSGLLIYLRRLGVFIAVMVAAAALCGLVAAISVWRSGPTPSADIPIERVSPPSNPAPPSDAPAEQPRNVPDSLRKKTTPGVSPLAPVPATIAPKPTEPAVITQRGERPSLAQFARMNTSELVQNHSGLSEAIAHAQSTQQISDLMTIDEIQRKLSAVISERPEVVGAALSVINYASFIRGKTGRFPHFESAKEQPCKGMNFGLDATLNRVNFNGGCSFTIDGARIVDSTFSNTVIIYRGGPLELRNVRFINCLFEVYFPEVPSKPAVNFANTILAENLGPTPTFTANR